MAKQESANKNPEEKKEIKEFPYAISLQFPVKWGEEMVSVITVQRRLKAKDFKGIKANDIRFDDMMRLISKVSGESIAFIEELDSFDLFSISEIVQSFLPNSLSTGDSR